MGAGCSIPSGTSLATKNTQAPLAIQEGARNRSVQPASVARISGTSTPVYRLVAREGPRLEDDLEEPALELAKADKVIIDFNLLYRGMSELHADNVAKQLTG